MEELKLMTILGAIEGASIRKMDYKYTTNFYTVYKNNKITKDIDESIALLVGLKDKSLIVIKMIIKINNCIFVIDTENAEIEITRADMYMDKAIECFLHMHLYNAMDIYNTLKNEPVKVSGHDYSVKDFYASTGDFVLSAGYSYLNDSNMVICANEYVKKSDKYFGIYSLGYYNNTHFASMQELSIWMHNIIKIFEEMGSDNSGTENR